MVNTKEENEQERFQSAALDFLHQDFDQCFEQMRHYDTQIFNMLSFMFVAYSGLIGISLGLFEYGRSVNRDFSMPAAAAISIGLMVGVYMFVFATRNRAYFVHVARYINEQRGFFLKSHPLGFENRTRMYTDWSKPPFFNWLSSQSWLLYIIATLNCSLFGALLFLTWRSNSIWIFVIFGSLILFVIQVGWAIYYLKSRENKSAERSVFGRQ